MRVTYFARDVFARDSDSVGSAVVGPSWSCRRLPVAFQPSDGQSPARTRRHATECIRGAAGGSEIVEPPDRCRQWQRRWRRRRRIHLAILGPLVQPTGDQCHLPTRATDERRSRPEHQHRWQLDAVDQYQSCLCVLSRPARWRACRGELHLHWISHCSENCLRLPTAKVRVKSFTILITLLPRPLVRLPLALALLVRLVPFESPQQLSTESHCLRRAVECSTEQVGVADVGGRTG